MTRFARLFDSRGKKFAAAAFVCAAALLCVALWLWRGGARRDPVMLILWHNPTGHAVSALTRSVERFNNTTGKEHNVTIQVTTVAKMEIIHENLIAIAHENPGAPIPPDIVIAYPKSIMPCIEKNMIAPLDDYFTEQELAQYVPDFVEAGRICDGKLYSFPIGKGVEGVIINRTLFDRFVKMSGANVTLADLSTFEGLSRAADAYYQWTDNATPDIPQDGKMFFMVDNPFNLLQAAFHQTDEALFLDAKTREPAVVAAPVGTSPRPAALNVNARTYKRVFDFLFEPAVRGREAVYKGYGTDLAKSGLLLCWTSATAGITFLPSQVNYPNNTAEPVEFEILPFPVFSEDIERKAAILRSGGFSMFKSAPERQEAAVLFLKWLTAPEENLHYVQGSGYLPVTKRAMEMAESEWLNGAEGIWKSYVDLVGVMRREYSFAPMLPVVNYGDLEIMYERELWAVADNSMKKYRAALAEGTDEKEAWLMSAEGAYDEFVRRTRGF